MQCDQARQQEGWRWEASIAMQWGVREGFLEELAWSAVGGNPGGKNSEGQGPVVEMNLAGSRDRREAERARLRNLGRKILQGPTQMGKMEA